MPIKCPSCGRLNADATTVCKCGRPLIDVPSDRLKLPGLGLGIAEAAPYPPEVVVVDVRMSFRSMDIFMVKWAIATIPAALILVLVVLLAMVVFGGIFSAVGWLR